MKYQNPNRCPQRQTVAGIVLFAVALAGACQGSRPDTGLADQRASPGQEAEQPRSDSVTSPIPAGSKTVKKACEGREMRLLADAGGDKRHIRLYFVPPGSAATEVAPPAEMIGYVPVGLACAISASDKKPYFIVQYGQRPAGCRICEWFYLYDSEGKQLTKSDPPMLKDETLPSAEQQYPNNDEYQTLIEKLGIQHPEVSYID